LMDIRSGFIAASILLAIWALAVFRSGWITFHSAARLTFYRIKRSRESRGRWLILASFLILAIAIFLPIYGQPVAYHYFPPSPTPSLTLTPSVVPTITLTPTITDTPLYSETPTGTPTPYLPLVVEAQFVSVVTPNPEAAISPLAFALAVTQDGLPQNPSTLFRNPIQKIYASFSYDKMVPGSQWSAVWFRNGEYVCHESYPWDGGTGGYYYSECANPVGGWQPGVYSVQMYVGTEFNRADAFTVVGAAPETPAPSPTPSMTATP
ncbi:MAG: hypothetical protein KJZ57_04280, partial [Anaerolineales bacterium]|nr:hypothetical protein [Anaerolineales bacterium]